MEYLSKQRYDEIADTLRHLIRLRVVPESMSMRLD